ncbi:HMCN1 [Symbiodinium sp. CCMP2592]|nr:HMCN1 [Symbiodinium sp. CCMP2592]
MSSILDVVAGVLPGHLALRQCRDSEHASKSTVQPQSGVAQRAVVRSLGMGNGEDLPPRFGRWRSPGGLTPRFDVCHTNCTGQAQPQVSCEWLDDCYEKGIMTPRAQSKRQGDCLAGLLSDGRTRPSGAARRSWMHCRTSLQCWQSRCRRILRRMLGAGDPQRAPSTRMVRRFKAGPGVQRALKDEPRGVTVLMLLFEACQEQAWILTLESVPAVIFMPVGLENSASFAGACGWWLAGPRKAALLAGTGAERRLAP